MTSNEYQREAMRTLNPALDRDAVLLNGVMGLCGEAGEAINIVKKHLAQGHPLDREALIRELGDVAWYLAETAAALDLDLETVLRVNLAKLRARYPEGFSAEQSMHRDKAPCRFVKHLVQREIQRKQQVFLSERASREGA